MVVAAGLLGFLRSVVPSELTRNTNNIADNSSCSVLFGTLRETVKCRIGTLGFNHTVAGGIECGLESVLYQQSYDMRHLGS